MGKASSPDYSGAAIAQGEANEQVIRDQTYANRPTQTTPFGSTTWGTQAFTDPASGESVTQWSQNQNLTPELQQILNDQISIQGNRGDLAESLTSRMGDEFSDSMDWANLMPVGDYVDPQLTMGEPTQNAIAFDSNAQSDLSDFNSNAQATLNFENASAISDPTTLRSNAENAVYNQAMSRIQPEYDASKQQKEIALRNRGLGPEDEAYKAEMLGLDNRFTDSRNQALWSANGAGRQEANQLFGQDVTRRGIDTGELMTQGNFQNSADTNQFNQAVAKGNFQNSADNNLFNQTMSQGNFANSAGNQNFNQAMGANNQNFNQAMDASKYATSLRQNQITEDMQKRGFTLNEINALLSGQQVNAPQMPSFASAGAAQPAPVYQGAVDQGNFNQAKSQQSIDAITGLASAGMGFLP